MMLWDTTAWRIIHQRFEPTQVMRGALDSIIWGLSFSPAGDKLLAVGNSGWMQVWSVDAAGLANGHALTKITPFLHGHTQALRGKFAPDGETFATSSFEGLIGLWQVGSGNAFIGHNSPVLAAQSNADGSQLKTIGSDARLMQWDTHTHAAQLTMTLHASSVITLVQVAFSRDGALVAGVYSATAFIWDTSTGDLRHSLTLPHTRTINALAFSANDVLATGDVEGQIILWNVSNGAVIAQRQVPKSQIYRLVFSHDGRMLASGGCRVPNKPDIRERDCGRNEVRLWDGTTLHEMGQPLPGKSGFASALAFDANDARLAVGTEDKTVTVWDLQTRASISTFNPNDGEITQLAFDPAGKELAVATAASRNIVLYNLETTQPVGDQFRDHRGRIQSLFYNSDGRILYSTADDGMAMAWDMDTNHWHERVCRMANRNLTNEEWQQYVGDPFYRKTCAQNS